MAYDHFGAPIKSTEVALAAFADAVESVKSHTFSGTAFMKPATTLPAVRVASSSVRDPMLAATNLSSQLSHELGNFYSEAGNSGTVGCSCGYQIRNGVNGALLEF